MLASIRSFLKHNPASSYFALTFAISWGVVLMVVGPSRIPGTTNEQEILLPIVFLALLAGPSIAGTLLTGLLHGRTGFRSLRARLLRWRVDARWYAIALLSAPAIVLVILFALSQISSDYLPDIFTTADPGPLLLIGLSYGLLAGLFEELGWTGVAIPQLRQRYGVLATGLIVGVLWAAWHVPVYVWGSGDAAGVFSWVRFLPEFTFLVAVLPGYRVLMVWVYDRTDSLLLATLMHASLTATTTAILVPSAAGPSRAIYYLILAAVLWGVVTAIAATNGGRFSRARLGKRAA